jgi:hypothetical protein
MLAELRLMIAAKEARLILKHGDTVIEDEVWKFERPASSTEAKEVVAVAFADAYDILNSAVHGDD